MCPKPGTEPKCCPKMIHLNLENQVQLEKASQLILHSYSSWDQNNEISPVKTTQECRKDPDSQPCLQAVSYKVVATCTKAKRPMTVMILSLPSTPQRVLHLFCFSLPSTLFKFKQNTKWSDPSSSSSSIKSSTSPKKSWPRMPNLKWKNLENAGKRPWNQVDFKRSPKSQASQRRKTSELSLAVPKPMGKCLEK